MRKQLKIWLIPALTATLLLSLIMGSGIGALSISPTQLFQMIGVKLGMLESGSYTMAQEAVFWSIRLPRVLAGALVGASLALSGACMQGLFRNPLADPGLIGVSAGASFAAGIAIVFGLQATFLGYYGLSVVTFLGSAFSTFLVYEMSKSRGKTLVATMLLAGIAINALGAAGTGFMTFLSDEAQLRNLSFWLLGSLGGANWQNVSALLPFVLPPLLIMPLLAKQLNAFALGENDAGYLGVNTARLKHLVIVMTTLAVGASVAISGIIGFIGLVIPHIIRLFVGADHRRLLPASMLLGASLLVLSDLVCRTILQPREIPIGIITAIIGAPLFLSILIREKKRHAIAL